MSEPRDVVCFDVTRPNHPHLQFWWLRDGVEQCGISDAGVIWLREGVTVEDALRVAAKVLGTKNTRKTSVDEALQDLNDVEKQAVLDSTVTMKE